MINVWLLNLNINLKNVNKKLVIHKKEEVNGLVIYSQKFEIDPRFNIMQKNYCPDFNLVIESLSNFFR